MSERIVVTRKYAKFLPDRINHGEWLQNDTLEPYYCSQCGKKPYPYQTDSSDEMYWRPMYCPNCGAFMDMREVEDV